MALVLADRIQETTTTTGTGTVTLLGAVQGYQSFAAVGNANTTYYTIAGQGTSEWEVGLGTYTSSGTTLSRTTVLGSSNAGSLVNFSAGTKNVFVTYPASQATLLDATQTLTNKTIQGGAISSGTVVASTSGTSIDFTSIPSWVKQITVMFNGVSFTATSPFGIVQIGSGSFTTSGYLGTMTTLVSASSVTTTALTTGFGYANFSTAADTVGGAMSLTTLGSNIWVATGTFGNTNSLRGVLSGGYITLGGVLDRVRITTTDGTTTFDAGKVNILYQ